MSSLVPPPRPVPLSLRLQLLFGGCMGQLGWGLLAFSMFFVLIFGSTMDIGGTVAFWRSLDRAPGVITKAEETDIEVNEDSVCFVEFTFKVGQSEYSDSCYTTGWTLNVGDQVQVEYPAGDPTIARVKGGRRSASPLWLLPLLLLFPAVSLYLVVRSFKKGLKANHLMTHGQVGEGEFVSKEATGAEINDNPVYRLAFKFHASSTGRTHTVTAETHQPERLQDDEKEPLLYLERDPDLAVLLDHLPGSPSVGADGNLTCGNRVTGFGVLVLPALALVLSFFGLAVLFI